MTTVDRSPLSVCSLHYLDVLSAQQSPNTRLLRNSSVFINKPLGTKSLATAHKPNRQLVHRYFRAQRFLISLLLEPLFHNLIAIWWLLSHKGRFSITFQFLVHVLNKTGPSKTLLIMLYYRMGYVLSVYLNRQIRCSYNNYLLPSI